MSQPKIYSPHWEKSLITNVKKTYDSWVKGFDLSLASPEVLEHFSSYADLILKNKVANFNTSIIESLIRQDLVLNDFHFVKIGKETYKLSSLTSMDKKRLIKESKTLQLIDLKTPECDLMGYLDKLTINDYERELVFLATSRFDRLVEKYKLQTKVDLQFVNQIYATTSKPLDLVKFIFFTMSQQPILKKDPLFKALYTFLSNSSLDDLYIYLKNN